MTSSFLAKRRMLDRRARTSDTCIWWYTTPLRWSETLEGLHLRNVIEYCVVALVRNHKYHREFESSSSESFLSTYSFHSDIVSCGGSRHFWEQVIWSSSSLIKLIASCRHDDGTDLKPIYHL